MKFATTDPAFSDAIRRAEDPGFALEMGRDRSRKLRSDWEEVKVDAMALAILLKFEQNPEARRVLLETGNAEIFEEAPDRFWGVGKPGEKGENKLGVLLMDTRKLLLQGNAAIAKRKQELTRKVLPDSAPPESLESLDDCRRFISHLGTWALLGIRPTTA
jgi:hypothetical protein